MTKIENKFIDTHCHLDSLTPEISESITNATENNVDKIITISVSPKNIQHVLDISNSNDNVYCSQGVHPHEAKDYSSSVKETIILNSKEDKVVAIGEIGLDYYYNYSSKEEQKNAFREQLQIASDLDLPIIVHSRDSDDDMIEILNEFKNSLSRKGVIHSFSGTEKLAKFCLESGFHLGFNGIVTFKKAQDLREIVKQTPVERILFETDSPYLTPTPHRGKENSPKHIPIIADFIAELKEVPDKQKFYSKVYQNSKDLFSLNN
jgi:TatD DNase family protein